MKALPRKGTQTAMHVDIDFNENYDGYNEILRKLVILTMSYVVPPTSSYRTFGLLVKKEGSNADHGEDYEKEMLCMLIGNRFLSKDQIYYMNYETQDRKIYYDNVEITSTYGTFNIDKANDDWKLYNNYIPYDLGVEIDNLELF